MPSVVRYTGAIDSIVWRMTADGLLGMDAILLNRGNGGDKGEFFDKNIYYLGLSFLPGKEVKGCDDGRGPYRVWKNRIKALYCFRENTIIPLPERVSRNRYTSRSSLGKPWVGQSTVHCLFGTDGLYRVFTPEEPVHRGMEKSAYSRNLFLPLWYSCH